MSTLPPELIAAIQAAPEDDLPRMIAADWLDEHDDPDWAALIRTQCRLAASARNRMSLAEREQLEYDLTRLQTPFIDHVRELIQLAPDQGSLEAQRGFITSLRLGYLRPGSWLDLDQLCMLESLDLPNAMLTVLWLPRLERLRNLRVLSCAEFAPERKNILKRLATMPRLVSIHCPSLNRGNGPKYDDFRQAWLASTSPENQRIAELAHFPSSRQESAPGEFAWRVPDRSYALPSFHQHQLRDPQRLSIEGAILRETLPNGGNLPDLVSLENHQASTIEPEAFSRLPKLRHLFLILTVFPDAAVLRSAFAHLPHLESLILFCPRVDLQSITHALKQCRKLRLLQLREVTITGEFEFESIEALCDPTDVILAPIHWSAADFQTLVRLPRLRYLECKLDMIHRREPLPMATHWHPLLQTVDSTGEYSESFERDRGPEPTLQVGKLGRFTLPYDGIQLKSALPNSWEWCEFGRVPEDPPCTGFGPAWIRIEVIQNGPVTASRSWLAERIIPLQAPHPLFEIRFENLDALSGMIAEERSPFEHRLFAMIPLETCVIYVTTGVGTSRPSIYAHRLRQMIQSFRPGASP